MIRLRAEKNIVYFILFLAGVWGYQLKTAKILENMKIIIQ